MALDAIPIYGVLKTLVRWLPGFYLRYRYPATRLAELIYLDIQPRCDAVHLNLGEAASLRLTLQVINLSPFSVEIDRATLKFNYSGGLAAVDSLKRERLAAGQIGSLYFESPIADGHANHMARDLSGNQAWLVGTVEFNCAVRPFARTVNLMNLQLNQLNVESRRRQSAGVDP